MTRWIRAQGARAVVRVRTRGTEPCCRLGVAVGLAVLALTANPGAQAQSSLRLAVVVNPAVPVKTLAAAELASVFTRSTRNWKDGSAIRALNLQPGSPERVVFDRAVLHMEPEQSAQFWVDRLVRGEEGAPKAIAKADIVVRLVATMPGAIAYVPEGKVDDKVRVVAFVRDGKVVSP